ncbi:hypothetical protein [Rhizobium lusitanum]|uniref:hypothetical protein n=1 Tax=Rhizobium lusitanum TaxID=293958 RepID=UPI00195ED3C7|nr:hypothetical protein [Rhizobium lusitanum]MBM7049715.1 hypothetical protein [Rhizobium lusitanum]
MDEIEFGEHYDVKITPAIRAASDNAKRWKAFFILFNILRQLHRFAEAPSDAAFWCYFGAIGSILPCLGADLAPVGTGPFGERKPRLAGAASQRCLGPA